LGDLSLPPCTPEQYLRRVRQEARSLPDVVCWQEWYTGNAGSEEPPQNTIEETNNNLENHEFDFIHGEVHMEYFRRIRERIIALQEESHSVELPKATDTKAWKSICWSFNDRNQRELCSMDSLPLKEWSCLDHVRCVSLVGLFEEWYRKDCSSLDFQMEEDELSRLVWLFGVLAALQPPLDADTEACIRSLLRHLIVKKRQYESIQTDHRLIDMVQSLIAVICNEFHQGYGVIENRF